MFAVETDPVCGRAVPVEPGALRVRSDEGPVYFCSLDCRSAFRENPRGYGDERPRGRPR